MHFSFVTAINLNQNHLIYRHCVKRLSLSLITATGEALLLKKRLLLLLWVLENPISFRLGGKDFNMAMGELLIPQVNCYPFFTFPFILIGYVSFWLGNAHQVFIIETCKIFKRNSDKFIY